MSAPDLAAIRARVDASTPEPWTFYQGWLRIGGMTVEQLMAYDESLGETPWKDEVDYFEPTNDADGEFIAHAREDLTALIDGVVAVLAIHRAWGSAWAGADRLRCDECLDEWPCATARALGVTG